MQNALTANVCKTPPACSSIDDVLAKNRSAGRYDRRDQRNRIVQRSRAEEILVTACALAGLDGSGARLLRLGENALFHLPAEAVVVRIARTMDYWRDAARKFPCLGGWLAQQFPAARVHQVTQPIEVSGHPVTFWQFINGRNGSPADIARLGALLRRACIRCRGLPNSTFPVKISLAGFAGGSTPRLFPRRQRFPAPPIPRANRRGVRSPLSACRRRRHMATPMCRT